MNSSPQIIILATRNIGKVRELKELLGSKWQVQSLEDIGFTGEIEETGETFKENALIKARTLFKKTGGFVLADDSGLECDDLAGAPGVYSARYAGPTASDEENNLKLIEQLMGIHDANRMARYVCALVLIKPDGLEFVVEETCEGLITFSPSGSGGFGYDPYFYLPEYKCTMADLPPDEKNKISHRGKALNKILNAIK
ncbi:MAG: Nucleoside-triphosphatase [uncultured bacterium]|nr:MAG: Nucleoside-triphosphatase [uncultured bacterium]